MTVSEMNERMDAGEYELWKVIYELEHEENQRAMKRAQSGNE
jgi:hypothetical protein